MAKSTAHKALASLKFKLTEALTALNSARLKLANSRNDAAVLNAEVVNLRRRVQELSTASNVSVSDARARVVAYADENTRLLRNNVQLQNDKAELKNKVESAVQAGWIYGAVVAAAAFGAGVAAHIHFPTFW